MRTSLSILALSVTMLASPVVAQTDVAPTEARSIAKDAYLFSYPLVLIVLMGHAKA